jgi:hypothetical protein
MPAGLNCKVKVWRRIPGTDDAGGGAMITGSVAYQDVLARYTARRPLLMLLAQGIETPRMAYFRLVPGTMNILENDEIEITDPVAHAMYGAHHRVVGVTLPTLNPKVGISELIVDVKHVEAAR